MAITEFFVDPVQDDNLGDGTIGDPYGDVQFGFNDRSHPASGGGRVNIKVGGDEILTAALDLSTYFTTNPTSFSNYLIFQGYTSAVDDHGIGGIDGDGSFSIVSDIQLDNILFRDMHLHNVGNNKILHLDDAIALINCELDGSTAVANNLQFDLNLVMIGCLIHDMQGNALSFFNGHIYRNRFIDDGVSNHFDRAIVAQSTGANIVQNLIWLNTIIAKGIEYDARSFVYRNSIFQNAVGTSIGIRGRGANVAHATVINNLVEGFSGTNGVGLDAQSTGVSMASFGNGVRNCSTPYGNTGNILVRFDEETLSASPFVDGAAKNFAPVNTGNVKEGSQPSKIGLFTYPS